MKARVRSTSAARLDRIVAQVRRLSVIPAQLDALQTHVVTLTKKVMQMDAATQAKLDALSAAVAANTSVEQSVKTLLEGLAAQIAELKKGVTDPAILDAIDAAAALVTANTAKFAADVTANTPA
jgi:hypothetical protein